MEAHARKEHEKGHKTDLFKLMKHHDKPRLTSGIWQRAVEEDDKLANRADRAGDRRDRPGGRLGGQNLLDVEAVIVGGGMGLRFGETHRDELIAAMHPHLFVDERPPDAAGRLARRPRRRHRRVAARLRGVSASGE